MHLCVSILLYMPVFARVCRCFGPKALEVLEAMEKDSGVRLGNIKVDGGMTANEPMLQFQV